MKHNLLKSVIISVILLMGVSNAWAGDPYISGFGLQFRDDGGTWFKTGTKGGDGIMDLDLGSKTNLKIVYIYANGNKNGGNLCDNNYFKYAISGTTQTENWGGTRHSEVNWDTPTYKWGAENSQNAFIDLVQNRKPGNYSMEFIFSVEGNSQSGQCGKWYDCKYSNGNWKFTWSIPDPTITITGANALVVGTSTNIKASMSNYPIGATISKIQVSGNTTSKSATGLTDNLTVSSVTPNASGKNGITVTVTVKFGTGGTKDYTYTYNVTPPAVNNFKVTASNVVSGTGTSGEPYVIACGKTTTLTVSGNKASTDANSSLYAKFGNNTYYSTLTKNLTPNSTKQSVQVKAKYYNSKDDLSGAETTTKTIYYRAQTFAVNITSSGNGTVTPSGTQQVGATTVSITATPNLGYAFKQWEVTGGAKVANATNASTTLTATAAGTVTAVFEEKPATTIYLEPTNFWNSDNPTYVAHVWNASGNTDIPMTAIGEAPHKYYTCKVPYGYTDVVFYRKSTNGTTIWNQTADLAIPTDTKTLYEILSTGEGTSTKATGVWKEANLVYTITLGSSMFGPYGISYNGQSYFSKDDADVVISLPYGATINFIEGQPYSDIYTGGIMQSAPTKVPQLDINQPFTVLSDVTFDDNYVTKVDQVAYLGVPNSSTWDNSGNANLIWRHDSDNGFIMYDNVDNGEFAFESNGVNYYKFNINAGCNKFQFQRKNASTEADYKNTTGTFAETPAYIYKDLRTGINCYMLDGTVNGTTHNGYWCALPAKSGDYRLLYVEQVVEKDANGNTVVTRKKAHPSDVVRSENITAEGKIVSLHIYKERTYEANAGGGKTYESSNNPEVILQRYDGSKWVDEECHMVFGPLETLPSMAMLPSRKNASVGSDKDDFVYDNGIDIIKDDTHKYQGSGVWNFYIINNGTKVTLDLNRTHRYEGQYYIRTDAAIGGWNTYTASCNHMGESEISMDHSNYSHYFCKWISNAGTNLKYTIANDYGMAISDTLEADATDIWGTPITAAQRMVGDDQLLPASANVRFSWNEKTNFQHRAYLAGSTDIESRFLVLEGKTNQLYNAEGNALAAGVDNGTDPRYGLNANEEIFNDISNWVYYADVQMIPGAELKLTAKYNEKVQYFIGQKDQYNNTVLVGTGSQKYLIRLLYDFKTNELISAYVPGGNTNIDEIQTNLMLLRKENETPRQLSFNTNSMKDVGKQAYGVLELTKATLIDNTQGKNIYERSLYWISFPFDVRITDIFGFGEYGKHWLIQSYDGEKRAREGLWADSETNWVYHFDPNTINAGTPDAGIMKKGVGYVVALNLKNIQAESPFVGRITTIALYFPSTTTITGHIVNTDAVSISVPKHECTIIRPTPDGDRHIKDSHWNVIGVPSYINAVGDFTGKISTIAEDLKFYYSWQGDHDKYEVVSGKSDVKFNSLNAYMVQFAGNLQWTNVLNESSPAGMAAKRNSDNMQEHHLCLELQQNGNEQDRTFIQLQEDEVTTAFDFNYDLCKIINKGANIYSLIATDRDPIEVAGNVLPVGEAIIPLGIKTDAAGEYTFAMPDGTDGIVVELIDYESNTRTNMLLDNYTVNLGKGTFESRFALHVKPNKITTSVEDINTNNTGVKKYLIDGVLYMQKDGVLYDAQGKLVR